MVGYVTSTPQNLLIREEEDSQVVEKLVDDMGLEPTASSLRTR